MLLLDHNLPHQLRDLLSAFGIKAETAAFHGWQQLRNGALVSAAHTSGFEAIFTRDLRFAESASKALIDLPTMAIVVVTLPQRSWRLYSDAFREAWEKSPAVPQPGKVSHWP